MSRITRFFKEVKGELLKVVWPSKRDTIRYTALVIVFSITVALILGAADYGLLKLFEKILNK
jgi:preprotein translocase subunit SecE